jgi:hypothetical protein
LALAAALAAAALSACDRKPLLRDWYVGRETLEPGRYIDRVDRDAWGEPILPPKEP